MNPPALIAALLENGEIDLERPRVGDLVLGDERVKVY